MITLSSDDSGNSAWKRALIVILACTLVVWIYGLRISQRFKHRNLPGPTPGWLVGQVGDLLKLGQPKAFQKWGEVYGPGLHTILLGSHGLVNICQPDTARKILYLPYRFDFEEHSIFPGFIRKQNDESILWRRGSKWRDLRAAWQPMFFTGSLEKYVPIFDRAALLLAKEISWAAAEGRVIDVYPMVQEMSMDVIGRAAFGVDLHAQKAETAEISTAERERGALIRQAAQDFFIPQNSSMWVVAGRLFPILLPVIRYLAERYPDEPLAKIIQSRVTIKKIVEDLIRDHRLSLGSGKELPGGLQKDGTQGIRRSIFGKRALIVLLAFATAVWIYGLRIPQRFRHRHLPGPNPGWLVGQVGDLLRLGQPKAFQKWGELYGPGLHAVLLGAHGFVNICQPDTARKITYLPNRFDFDSHTVFPAFIRKQIGESILSSRGSKWRNMRATWQPMFFTGSLENYVPVFDRAAILLAEEISWAAAEGRFINVYPMVQDMSLDVISRAAFGVDLHTQKAETAEIPKAELERGNLIRQAAQDFFIQQNTSKWMVAGRLFPILLGPLRFLAERFPDEPLAKIIQSRITLKEVVEGLIHDHRLSLAGKEVPAGADEDGTPSIRRGVAPGSFIDLLVQSTDKVTGKGLSDLNISEQVLTMLLGGFETTSSTITFALYLLGKPSSSEKQAKAVAEVDALGKDWVPTFADMEGKLPYLDAVIKESLRLFPPGHLVIREAETDMIVEDYPVAKGTPFYFSAYAIHNNPRVWGDSVATFLPERWLTMDPVAAKKAKSSLFGFGDGPRSCPGNRFAMTEPKIALVRILQRLTVELQPGQDPLALKDSITLTPGNGCYLRPIPRS